MRRAGWPCSIRYRLRMIGLRLLYRWYGVRELWDDLVFWVRMCRAPAFVSESDFRGCYSNRTRRERFDVWVSPARPKQMVAAYLRTITPRQPLPVLPRTEW